MARFPYQALDAQGRTHRGEIDVVSQTQAIKRIRDMGFYPTRILSPRSEPRQLKLHSVNSQSFTSTASRYPGATRYRIGRKKLSVFTRQLATLLEAGLPLLRGLRLLERQEKQVSFRNVLRHIQQHIESGGTLSEALSRHPRIFSVLYLSMIKAGEAGGVLDLALNRLAEFMEKAQKIQAKTTSALAYPGMVLIVAGLVVALLLTVIVPRFEGIYLDLLGTRGLPPFTRQVVEFSRLIQEHFLWLVTLPVVGWCAFRLLRQTGRGRFWLDYVRLHLPVIGVLVQQLAIGRTTRSLGTLLKSGVPILPALTTIQDIAGNRVFGNALQRIQERVKEGDNITTPLEAAGLFPATLVGMVEVGEQTGALPDMLLKVADLCDAEADHLTSTIMSLLEPILILIIAIIVGCIIVAMFMPLLALTHGAGSGVEGP